MLKEFIQRKAFWIEDTLKGNGLWKEYKDVRHISANKQFSNWGGINRIINLLEYARENTVFYQELGISSSAPLSAYPVMDKNKYLADYDKFIVPLGKIRGQKGEIHVQKTSGSTGIPFRVPQDTLCRTRRLATIKYENDLLGFRSFMPLLHLRAFSHYWDWESTDGIKYNSKTNIYYADNANLTEERAVRILETVNRRKISFIRGYMTTLDLLTKTAVREGIVLKYKPTFISVGELLQDGLVNRVSNELGCRIVSQYANEENGVFGTSPVNKPGTDIDLNCANCLIEILKMESDEPAGDDELGRLVVTDFVNHAFPMIRYDIGDLAMVKTRSDDGRIIAIRKLAGRKTDLIYKTDGEVIDLYNSMPKEIYNCRKIKRWQFVQKSEREYELLLMIYKQAVPSELTQYFQTSLRQILGKDSDISISIVNDISTSKSGKLRNIKNEWKTIN